MPAANDGTTDRWKDWLLNRRSGGDERLAAQHSEQLSRVRDKVLRYAAVKDGETLLDVGCGDGLIAFAALDRVGASGRVIFSDISQPLLDHCRRLAEERGAGGRCGFVPASADDLAAIPDSSVDVVTTRSVLIFLRDKRAALREFYRVLRPGGRTSLFEPINRYSQSFAEETSFLGFDIAGVEPLAMRVRDVMKQSGQQFAATAEDFDEQDLVAWAEEAGFPIVRLVLEITAAAPRAMPAWRPPSWEAYANAAPNPLAPSLAEAMREALSDDEVRRLESHLRPQLEQGKQATAHAASAYLHATKVVL